MTLAIIVLELLAILANFSLPLCQSFQMRYKAADLARQMTLVRNAAETARAQRGAWPDDRSPGEAPPELAAYLPPGFTFAHADYQLDWDHWALAEGGGVGLSGEDFTAVTVIAHDPRLAAAVARQLSEGEIRMTLGNRTTLVIPEPESPGR